MYAALGFVLGEGRLGVRVLLFASGLGTRSD